jgi:hypothetical protein
MANWLKMDKHNAALGLARQGWSFRRIGAELGIDRGTVARHVRAAAAQQAAVNAAISIAGVRPARLAGRRPAGSTPGRPAAAANACRHRPAGSKCRHFDSRVGRTTQPL